MSPQFRRHDVISQILLVFGLATLWCLLWGSFDALTIGTGVLLGAGVSIIFFLPAVGLSGRINPWRVIVFLVKLLIDIVRASIHITVLVLAPRYTARNAIVAVKLRTDSDLIMTWTAEAISIVPGSIVVDLDRAHSTLYIHLLNVADAAGIHRFIAEVLGTERRLILAIGSRAEARAVRTAS